ncbi:MAG: protein kinase, partial [Planctomycetota bacterium]
MNERVIFDAALEMADPKARRALIEKACAGNPGLLSAVETLLKSHDASSSFLNVPVAEQMRSDPASDSDAADSSKPSEVFDKTRHFQSGPPGDDDSDDESQPDLSFLQPSSKPGSIGLLGHYEILQVLGQGGFGIVLKAFDEKLHRLVAVKVMNPQLAATSPPRKRFLREARAAAAIRHENVVQVYSVEEQPLPYLVMEYIDGQTLQQKQKDHGPLEVAELLHIGRQVASGLAAAQAMGLIHRDIKPGNILIEQGAEQKVKITDFGLARAADDASLTRSGTISGTPMYMAPEQVLGQALDNRADLFSLGSVLYELATGRPPFRATNTIAVLRRVTEDTPRPMQEIIPEIPDWLVAIVTKLHAKNPDDRFQSAKEVADLLARCQSELQLTGKVTCVNEVRVGREAPDDVRRGSPDPAETLDRRSPLRDESQAQGDLQFRTGEVRSANATPTPAQPKRRFRASHFLVAGLAGLMVILAGTQLGRIANPYVQKWLWPPIPKLAVTEVATGLRFDGKDDFVKVGPIDLSSPQYTLEAFVTSASDGDNGVIALLKNAEKEPELMYLYDGYPGKERKSGAGIVGQRPYQSVNAPLPSGTREHRALVVDGQVMHYFVNGIWQGKRNCTARKGLMWEMRELHLGCMANQTQFFRGQIDQLRLSKIARYNNNFTVASKLTSDDSTLVLYNFDEADGDVLNDSSGHGHHGKIVGATWASPNSSSSSRAPAESIGSTDPDRRAAEWVQSIGGNIKIKDNGQERTVVALGELPGGAFELTFADLHHNPKVSDEGLANFKNCKNLTMLELHNTQVGDEGLANFKECKNLTVLNLANLPASDVGMANFKDCKNLTELVLQSTNVSDLGLAHFKDCKHLTYLDLYDTKVSDAGLVHFQQCQNLLSLVLHGTKVSDAGLANFKDCKNLTVLVLSSTGVSDAGLAHFRGCQHLKRLDLMYARKVGNAGLAHFKDCKNLSIVYLTGIQLTDSGLAQFQDYKNLSELHAVGALVSDAGLEHLVGCTKLGLLSVKATKVTEAGVKKLSAALPGCKIEWDGGVIEPTVSPDRRAAEWLISIGGRIRTKTNQREGELEAVAKLPDEGFELTAVDVRNNSKMNDAGLDHLQDCKNLTNIWLSYTKVSDAGLAHLKGCKSLTILALDYTEVSDVGLTHFQGFKNLGNLGLTGTKISDAGLAHVQAHKNLAHVELSETEISDAGLERLSTLPKLKFLRVAKTKVTEAGVKKLSAALPGCKIEWDGGVIEPTVSPDRRAAEWTLPIGGYIQIKENGQQRQITAVGELPRGAFELTLVRLAGNQKASDAGLATFQDCRNLTELNLNYTPVTDAGLAHFKNCKNLIILELHGTQLSDAGLANFQDCHNLSILGLAGTQLSGAGLVHFKDC